VAEKASKSDLRLSMSVTRYKSRTKIRTAEAMSCRRSSVKADKVNAIIQTLNLHGTYDSLGSHVSQCVDWGVIEGSYGNC
jgi:hypothetical protein